jgi:hypothetical protein
VGGFDRKFRGISDVTEGDWERAQELLPVETPYAVAPATARRLGMNQIPVYRS